MAELQENSCALKTLQTSCDGHNLVGGRRRWPAIDKNRKLNRKSPIGRFCDSSKKRNVSTASVHRNVLVKANNGSSSLSMPLKVPHFCAKSIEKIEKRDSGIGTDFLEFRSRAVQTDDDTNIRSRDSTRKEIVEMMISAEPPNTSQYWQSLAEQRRLALDDALKENMEICKELVSLREKNLDLQKLVAEAQEAVSMMKAAIDDYDEEQNADQN